MAQANPQTPGRRARPLSPHLQIYKSEINMVMSIWHRITGAALYVGTLLLAIWLLSVASGPTAFGWVNGFLGSWLGLLVLAGYTWALLHHMVGGLRHLVWDTGRGFSLPSVRAMSWGTVLVSLLLTAVIWAGVLKLKGLY